MKLPTKAQWDEIGEAFDTPFRSRTEQQKHIAMSGLCYAVDVILNNHHDCRISPEYKIPDMIVYGKFRNIFWRTSNKRRAFFCCMMAAITEAGDMKSLIEEA